jgi:hypothetical protein
VTQPIEGLPPGLRIRRLRLPAEPIGPGTFNAAITLEPDNVYGVLDLWSVPIPEGYERAGGPAAEWFREPVMGDMWLHRDGSYGNSPVFYVPGADRRRILLRKKTRRVLVCEFDVPYMSADPLLDEVGKFMQGCPLPGRWGIENR